MSSVALGKIFLRERTIQLKTTRIKTVLKGIEKGGRVIRKK